MSSKPPAPLPPVATSTTSDPPPPAPRLCVEPGCTRPATTGGARFGVVGDLCQACYARRWRAGEYAPIRPTPPPPCAIAGCPRPGEVSGERFGVAAKVCRCCYKHLGRRSAASSAAAPCSACGTTSGFIRAGTSRPVRHRVTADGRELTLCQGCRWATPDEWDADDDLPPPPSPGEIAARAAAELERRARRAAKRLARRRRLGWGRGGRLTPEEGSRRAVIEFDSTIFGRTVS